MKSSMLSLLRVVCVLLDIMQIIQLLFLGTFNLHSGTIEAFILSENCATEQTIPTAFDLVNAIGREYDRLHKQHRIQSAEDFQNSFKKSVRLIRSMATFKGRHGALKEIRKVRELAKRPGLMRVLRDLFRSPFFNETWTPNTFTTIANYDPTVSIITLKFNLD